MVESDLKDPETLIGIQKRYIKVNDDKSEIVRSGGLPSFLEILAVEPVPENRDCYQVFIRLITGRTHQIRVMLADMGIPLCGDHLYNPESKDKDFYLESIILKFTDPDNIEQRFYYENFQREIEISKALKDLLKIL